MKREQARLEQLRRWKLAASWAPVVWFPLGLFALSVGAHPVAAALVLAGIFFAAAARFAVWLARCPSCGEAFRARPGGFERAWDEAGCSACGASLFAMRRAEDGRG